LALNYKNFISIGLFDTLGLDQLVYILNHSQSAVTFCQFDKIPLLLKLSAKLDHLKVIVCIDYKPNQSKVFEVLKKWNNSIGKFKLLKFDQVMKFGEEFNYPDNLPKPDDIATICYTSGTTGTPKGAMLRHYSLQLVAYSSNQMLKPFEGEENTLISYMPLSHCYERNCQYRTLLMKGRVGFYSGDVTRLFEDIRTLKPTSFATVPRVLNRIYDIIKSKFELQSGLNGSLFKVALYHKQKIYNSTGDFTHPIWDKLIFSKVRELLGGKLRFISCGSAPLQGHILHFLRLVFGLSIVEGYGATETTTTISITPVGDHRANHVGAPLAHCEVKLASIPEMEYLVSDKPYPRGEILVRGDTLFRGYYKEPEKTHDAFDSEGFYKTGDVGYINEEGLMTIIDRKSSFFKLSQGEFVTPERVEHIIRQHPVVQTAFITGLRTESTTVCIVVPDLELFKTWYSKEFPSLNLDSINSLGSNLLIREKLLEEMKNLCKKNKIAK
jgi:long-chain acyl-CoA synthetase